MRNLLYCILTSCYSLLSTAQRIDNTAAVHQVEGETYFRFHYNNDFFTKTDYYYTQGYQFELAAPFLKKNPLQKLLFTLNDEHVKYGLAFEHYGFTPTSIQSDVILYNDRPFAGVILLKTFAISVNVERKERLSAILSTGMTGPAAFAGRMQATIHRWTDDAMPHGWQYQIRNDIAINYELSHEKEIFNIPTFISLHTNTRVMLGSLSDKVQGGLTLTLGRFSSPFANMGSNRNRNFQFYAYCHPAANFVGYDATLQGGIFNRSSPYVIRAGQINRLTFQNNAGIVAHFWKIYLEYSQTFLSREFRSGKTHRWAGLTIGYAF